MAEKAAEEPTMASSAAQSLPGPSNYQSIIDSALAAAAPVTAAPSDFSTSLSTWREVNLPALQSSLENLCPTLVNSQKDALLSRKKLAEQTREFRKLGPESQGEAIKPLLKSYQSEIDSLTKRAKSAENAVLSVRDRLQTANDPYPILEAVLEQTANVADMATLKEQVEELQKKNVSFETQVKALPSIEAEKNRLSNQLAQLESKLESRISESRKSIEAEVSAKWDERIRNYVTREQTLSKSLESTQAQLKEVRGNYAKVTERLLQHGEEVERDQTNGKIEELDVISEELSRSNERVRAMERRNEQLRQEIERLKLDNGEEDRRRDFDRRQLDSEEEIRRLSRLLEEEGSKSGKVEGDLKRRIQELEAQSKERERETMTLRRRIQAMGDYDEVKRELEIFKYVEFAVEADAQLDDADEEGGGRKGERSASTSAKPLEALLIEKNRQLQGEVTNMRVAKTELDSTSNQTQKELEKAKSEVQRLRTLNERLEDDLISLKPGGHSASAEGRAGPSMSAEEALAEMDEMAKGEEKAVSKQAGTSSSSPRQAPIPFDSSTKSGAAENRAASVNPPSNSSSSTSSILPIITSQRDRFRARNAELEEELRKQFDTISELRGEVKALQADNLSLYEKMRYLQAYGSNGNSGSSGQNFRGPGGGSRIINISARNDAGAYPPASSSNAARGEDKYRDKYEAAMNPFEQFRGREQSRAFNSLNPLERVLHMLTRLVLGHRRMRIFFIVYAISLHFLVFAMLFEIEFYSSSPSDSLRAVQPAGLNA